ncbi:translation initiation factor SUI1-domain-containing protein [Naematelia encephala]|uniref:Translation initiation factor SUI1-domain-containing protein n=1 Tax=Naematelia encephala TaxID=71784 RepID=A0A1Y2B592_9TREE|nr:translation initiation factor SUI1-domain-containing protein [Naematelia encephala]
MGATATTDRKVDSTTKRPKPSAPAGDKSKTPAPPAGAGVTNLGPQNDPFVTIDPFAPGPDEDGTPSNEASVGRKNEKIHIRLQQRNGRKTVTTIQGVPKKYDPKKLVKAMKKEFACNGTVLSSLDSSDEESPVPGKEDFGKVLHLQGDHRVKAREFLIARGLVSEKEAKDLIVVHGY